MYRMKLNDWISRQKMTKREICDRLNVNHSLIYLWAQGKRNISDKLLKELSRITQGEVSHVDDVRNG